jgi:chemotaxis protein CheD
MTGPETRSGGGLDSVFARNPDLIEVMIGELVVAEAPKRLVTPALGSCVGIALYDPFARRGGLAHIMLPTPHGETPDTRLGRFADHAVPRLVEMMRERGSLLARIEARIAGGAAMFKGDSAISTIGERNVAEVKRQLALMSVPLVAEDTGEAHARTLEIRLDSGETFVRSYLFGVRTLAGPKAGS